MKRRTLLKGATGAVLPASAKTRPSIFEQFAASLVQVHGELREGARGIAQSIVDDEKDRETRSAITAFTTNLLDHHKSEDVFFFPAFRAAGRLRSSDVAFLAKKDEEHVAIHQACVELRDTNTNSGLSARAWRATSKRLIADLGALSRPHFAEEENTLTAEHVATMISEPELVLVYRDMGKNWHRK